MVEYTVMNDLTNAAVVLNIIVLPLMVHIKTRLLFYVTSIAGPCRLMDM